MAARPKFGKRASVEKIDGSELERLYALAAEKGFTVAHTAAGVGLFQPGETTTDEIAALRWRDFLSIYAAPPRRAGRR
jgi:hypothetical protein